MYFSAKTSRERDEWIEALRKGMPQGLSGYYDDKEDYYPHESMLCMNYSTSTQLSQTKETRCYLITTLVPVV